MIKKLQRIKSEKNKQLSVAQNFFKIRNTLSLISGWNFDSIYKICLQIII